MSHGAEFMHDPADVAAEFGVDLAPSLTEFLLARIAEDEAWRP